MYVGGFVPVCCVFLFFFFIFILTFVLTWAVLFHFSIVMFCDCKMCCAFAVIFQSLSSPGDSKRWNLKKSHTKAFQMALVSTRVWILLSLREETETYIKYSSNWLKFALFLNVWDFCSVFQFCSFVFFFLVFFELSGHMLSQRKFF